MRIEVIHHEHNFLCLGVMHVHQFANEVCPVLTGSVLSDFDETFSSQWFTGQENLAHPCCFKRVIDSFRLSRLP